VIITVPVEDPEHLEEHYHKNNHINAFDVHSFDYLKERGLTVTAKKYLDKRILQLGMLLENDLKLEHQKQSKHSKIAYTLFNLGKSLFRGGRREAWAMSRLVAADERISRSTKDYAGVFCVILKDPSCYGRPRRRVTAARIMKSTVPPFYLDK
jgi:hypothetical protein